MKEINQEKREEVISQIKELNIGEYEAEIMLDMYLERGSLPCMMLWPARFSISGVERNVFDVIVENDLV